MTWELALPLIVMLFTILVLAGVIFAFRVIIESPRRQFDKDSSD